MSTAKRIESIQAQLAAKLGVRSPSLSAGLPRIRHRLPGRVYRQARKLARAEDLLEHPVLRRTLDDTHLSRAAAEVADHLERIDLADRRKGWWLGMLTGMVFNLLLAVALFAGFLYWLQGA